MPHCNVFESSFWKNVRPFLLGLGLLVNSEGEFLFYCLFCPAPSHLFGTLDVNIVNGNLILNKGLFLVN